MLGESTFSFYIFKYPIVFVVLRSIFKDLRLDLLHVKLFLPQTSSEFDILALKPVEELIICSVVVFFNFLIERTQNRKKIEKDPFFSVLAN